MKLQTEVNRLENRHTQETIHRKLRTTYNRYPDEEERAIQKHE